MEYFYYAPAILMCVYCWGGHIVSPLSVCTSVLPVCNKNGFHLISFEKIGVLDANFIHRHIIIK